MNYKNLSKVLVFAFVLSLALPIVSLAVSDGAGRGEAGNNNEKVNSCANLVAGLENRNKKLVEQFSQYKIKRAEQLKKISENRLTSTNKLLDIRTKVDANRDNRITKLEARATTTEQKAAITTFRATLATITEARRLAIDSAVKTYHGSVDQTLATRQSSIETVRASLNSDVEALLARVRADCSGDITGQTIQTRTNTGLKTVRQQFGMTISDLDKTNAIVKTATEVRKEAVKKAQNDFKTAYKKALDDLKTAFER